VVIIGSNLTPLLTGQVDCISVWLSWPSLAALNQPFVALRLWDAGIKLYGHPLYATHDTFEKKPDMLAGFLKATARGYAFALQEPEKSASILFKEYPNLSQDGELYAIKKLLSLSFGASTLANGWGTFDPQVWQDQINIYDELEQFSAGAPKLDDVMTTSILDATANERPKLGSKQDMLKVER
jgi:NitT/TauT family transport system substrate-binding protein